jgi:anti-sigma B factor antagonist
MRMTNVMDDIATVMLPERVDSATSASVEALMFAALRPGARVIVDGSAVTYMSAAGVRVLATTIHRAEEQETRIVLCSFSGPAADCLLVSGFSHLFDVADSVDEAMKRLRPNLVGNPADRLHPRGAAG